MEGIRSCETKNVQFKAGPSKLVLEILCSGKIDGNYDLKGQILVLPIEGKESLEIHVELDIIEKKTDDGKVHWNIKIWQYSFKIKDKSEIVFENLYNKNDVLDKAVQELISTNGNDIIKEVGWPVIKACVGKVVRNINNLFKSAPMDDLVLNSKIKRHYILYNVQSI